MILMKTKNSFNHLKIEKLREDHFSGVSDSVTKALTKNTKNNEENDLFLYISSKVNEINGIGGRKLKGRNLEGGEI